MTNRLIAITAFAAACVIVALAGLLGWHMPVAAVGRALDSPVLSVLAVVIAVAACAGWVLFLTARHGPDLAVPARMPRPRDPLYDMTRRSDFMKHVEAMLEQHVEAGRQLALHVVDVDGFGAINDRQGYDAGDAVLHALAERLTKLVEDPTHVARTGSDEFAVLQREVGGAKHAQIFAGRIANALAEAVSADSCDVTPTVSIGYAVGPDHGSDAATLLRHADLALKQARHAGGAAALIYREDMRPPAPTAGSAMPGLSIEEDWIELRFQPRYDLSATRLIGFEALAWIHHPELRRLSPAEYGPMAAASGMTTAVAALIAEKAITAAGQWPTSLTLALKLSTEELQKAELVDSIIQMAEDAGVSPERLHVEVTAPNADADDLVKRQLTRLAELGVRLVLDDFGTGGSAVLQIWHHAFDAVKIDVSVVPDLASDPFMARFAGAIVDMARSLEVDVVAEGVETAEQVRFLVGRGCLHVQGNLFGAPLPPDALAPVIMRDVKNRTATAGAESRAEEAA